MRVLVPLLRAYPHYCPYEVLAASLFSLSLAQARHQLWDSWEVAIKDLTSLMLYYIVCISNI
jgi:hypothetical protein